MYMLSNNSVPHVLGLTSFAKWVRADAYFPMAACRRPRDLCSWWRTVWLQPGVFITVHSALDRYSCAWEREPKPKHTQTTYIKNKRSLKPWLLEVFLLNTRISDVSVGIDFQCFKDSCLVCSSVKQKMKAATVNSQHTKHRIYPYRQKLNYQGCVSIRS